ncbi:FAD-dependent oxidoreductase [Hydrogenophaga sp.]|uniref:FAD-dependent oxidoreductase n=1 Tax=Hydrogenophaga sp. TaxID=1904254 RepID=UPI003567B872
MTDRIPTKSPPGSISGTAAQVPVLILGAGLMGRLLAVVLAQAGHRVRVVEATDAQGTGSAARVAAAMLAPLAESAITEPCVVAMGRHALLRWPELLSRLPEPAFFQRAGTLVLWHRQDEAQLHRFGSQMANAARALPSLPRPQPQDSAGVAALEPALAARFNQGLFLPEEGQLESRQLLRILMETLPSLGVSVQWNTAYTLAQARAEQEHQGGWVLDCRGLGAQPDWSRLRGVRGEVLRLHAPDVHLNRPIRLLHPRYPIYIAPKPDHVYVVGATEIESSDSSPASVRSTLELLSAAYAVHPGFGEARILEIGTHNRPTLPDNLPSVRQIAPQVLQINGLYRHGFLVAPAMLDVVCEWMQHGRSQLAQALGVPFAEPSLSTLH